MSTRNEVLKLLESHRGEPVSGGFMANKLGVSRNSVWKAVKKLREEGYSITGGSGVGYALEDDDILSAEGIASCYSGADGDSPELEIACHQSIDSTNKEAKRLALGDPKTPLLIVADEQTGGSGRNGRSFWSPPGSGLYMSFLLRPDFDLGKAQLLTTAASVAVCEAVREVAGKDCGIKWVNDVYLDGKKICGILTEAVTDFESGGIQFVIVGIGINCHPAGFPDDIKDRAGFIGGDFSRNALAASIAKSFIPMTQDIENKSIIERYRDLSFVPGHDVTITRIGSNEKTRAHAKGIADNGGLIVEYEDGTTSVLTSGEISIRL